MPLATKSAPKAIRVALCVKLCEGQRAGGAFTTKLSMMLTAAGTSKEGFVFERHTPATCLSALRTQQDALTTAIASAMALLADG